MKNENLESNCDMQALAIPISETIRRRLMLEKVSMNANNPIGEHLLAGELDQLQIELEEKMQAVLDTLLIDTTSDHNTEKTAARVAKMYLREVFAGRYQPPPPMTDFPNVGRLDEVYTVGPITIRSACSHHLCPIEGELWCGVIPSARVIGLSKFSRIARWVMARPQIQEEAIMQLADKLETLIQPKGLALVMKARHSCMTWRGVMEHDTTMTTSVMRGYFKHAAQCRQEFFSAIGGQRFTCN